MPLLFLPDLAPVNRESSGQMFFKLTTPKLLINGIFWRWRPPIVALLELSVMLFDFSLFLCTFCAGLAAVVDFW
jgi:hypothetical protein